MQHTFAAPNVSSQNGYAASDRTYPASSSQHTRSANTFGGTSSVNPITDARSSYRPGGPMLMPRSSLPGQAPPSCPPGPSTYPQRLLTSHHRGTLSSLNDAGNCRDTTLPPRVASLVPGVPLSHSGPLRMRTPAEVRANARKVAVDAEEYLKAFLDLAIDLATHTDPGSACEVLRNDIPSELKSVTQILSACVGPETVEAWTDHMITSDLETNNSLDRLEKAEYILRTDGMVVDLLKRAVDCGVRIGDHKLSLRPVAGDSKKQEPSLISSTAGSAHTKQLAPADSQRAIHADSRQPQESSWTRHPPTGPARQRNHSSTRMIRRA